MIGNRFCGLSVDELHAWFVYDENTGVVTWRKSPNYNAPVGKVVGNSDGKRLSARFNGTPFRIHRLVWFMAYGWCPKTIDHINGNALDNRISNLRPCTISENGMNQALSTRNKSGYKGVSYDKVNNKWFAAITKDKHMVNLGRFESKEDAARKYNEAARQHFGPFARLNEVLP